MNEWMDGGRDGWREEGNNGGINTIDNKIMGNKTRKKGSPAKCREISSAKNGGGRGNNAKIGREKGRGLSPRAFWAKWINRSMEIMEIECGGLETAWNCLLLLFLCRGNLPLPNVLQ
jgi:hypothetical protein